VLKDINGLKESRILITCAKGVTPYLREEMRALAFL
jgi:hypothetical protein